MSSDGVPTVAGQCASWQVTPETSKPAFEVPCFERRLHQQLSAAAEMAKETDAPSARKLYSRAVVLIGLGISGVPLC
jgi:hypothetical protein